MKIDNLIDFFNQDIETEIEIYNFGLYSAGKKEKATLKESFKNLEKGYFGSYTDNYQQDFYCFELLLEMFNRFHLEMGVSGRSLKYLNVAFEDLKIAFRLQMLGYYNTAGMHLRGMYEKIIHFVIYYYIDTGIINEYEVISKKRKKYFIENNLSDKFQKCMTLGSFSCWNPQNKGKDVYNEFYFPKTEVLKIYKHYSFEYIHNGKPESNLQFCETNFKKIDVLMRLTHVFTARFMKITIGDIIEEFWSHKVIKRLDSYHFYWNYLQSYFNENKIFTHQYSYLYNLLHDDKDNHHFAFNELGLDLYKLFPKDYVEQCMRVDENKSIISN